MRRMAIIGPFPFPDFFGRRFSDVPVGEEEVVVGVCKISSTIFSFAVNSSALVGGCD